ncbi:MAG: YggS family pyridoxal phosphate-dependent enzyme, partial [Mariprofundaceae bacterium]|nr:YggS family pyridoxal phosphate-dependent enzyme [Mariprofundaceae bacterium]
MSLLKDWQDISTTLARTNTHLLAVSKYTTDEAVQMLIDAGQVDFAESRPQNLRDRAKMFPNVRWHFIGPLQKNKAKYI